ncbi:hypothetical protein SCHPADRAFT_944003 [Schizopora paradoxa]|uniref:Uncharacterized protein n=1 Tax=Schizopora paradoxa TaxID=27342 RepID=A0A0H2RB01_9AGAM|nr:hypothetical protein SCHPADRAFT_944003 [Schizopora paradoxa]
MLKFTALFALSFAAIAAAGASDGMLPGDACDLSIFLRDHDGPSSLDSASSANEPVDLGNTTFDPFAFVNYPVIVNMMFNTQGMTQSLAPTQTEAAFAEMATSTQTADRDDENVVVDEAGKHGAVAPENVGRCVRVGSGCSSSSCRGSMCYMGAEDHRCHVYKPEACVNCYCVKVA